MACPPTLQAYRTLVAQEASTSPVGTSAGAVTEDQSDLACWHRVEQANPGVFGRMHIVYAQKSWHFDETDVLAKDTLLSLYCTRSSRIRSGSRLE